MIKKELDIETIIGLESEPKIHDALHHLSHHGSVDYLTMSEEDMKRKRLRATTGEGRECRISLARNQKLQNGSVLYMDDALAIVVRARQAQWLSLEPASLADGIELGYFAGNMHWRVAFEGPVLKIALDGAPSSFKDRISHFLESGRVRIVANE